VQPGAPGLRALGVSQGEWMQAAQDLAAAGARLVTLWATCTGGIVPIVRALFLTDRSGLLLSMPVSDSGSAYPGIERLFPAAGRMQRTVADLCGLRSSAEDTRPWVRHAAWPPDYRPLADPPRNPDSAPVPAADPYEFVRVDGDGVHEIAVGPVHAGIIEPGHFRFSVVGEKVLRLEERFGYAHKGTELRFTGLAALEAHRLAARVSGDSAVAFSWACCQALEAITEVEIPARATWLRALYLELERIANHLGDIGGIGNDAGFAFGLAQFSRLKEQLLRANEAANGARYLMDAVLPGGTWLDLTASGARTLGACLHELAGEVEALRSIYDEHEGVRDRFMNAGTVTPELALRLGLAGLAGRASGQAFDLRVDLPCAPYPELSPRMKVQSGGDVAARVAIRFEELRESFRLVARILSDLPPGPHRTAVPQPREGMLGIGMVEGWRGPAVIALETGPGGKIRRCHPHDVSTLNWPVVEHAAIGNIVPDFPLINKSFNLAYSGHDL